MSIVTRIDGRSMDNNHVHIVDKEGFILATIVARGGKTELEVRTSPHFHIEKANGFSSKK